MKSLVVLNKPKKKGETSPFASFLKERGLHLTTCIRELFFLCEPGFLELQKKCNLEQHYEVFQGLAAYEYVIQVLSGLDSPVLGETEVFGQFKNQVLPQLDQKVDFKESFDFILNMVKWIRSKHLIGLGSQTYGSLVRRLLKGEQHVLFVGAGNLTTSLLPWIKKQKKVMISVRDPKKHNAKEEFKTCVFNSVNEPLCFDFPLNVVICAPVSSTKLKEHIEFSKVNNVIDLREESASDPLTDVPCRVVNLREAFSMMSAQKDQKNHILQKVKTDLNQNVAAKFTKHRPFGWEDLC